MDRKVFKAMLVRETIEKGFTREIVERSLDDLPEGDLVVRVNYSSLNYKDALSATGNKGVTKSYPHTPGIDAAGVVLSSENQNFKAGEQVFVTGYDFGMNTDGGFGQYVRIPSRWALKMPEGLSLKESMMFGTAGFTAALSIYKMRENGVLPEHGDILVTGATGGVGSIAVSILSKLGYTVIAGTGKPDSLSLLQKLGAKEIILREELDDQSGRALLKPRWAGVIDTVGGNILATAIKSTGYGGTVTACGNVSSPDLITTVYPFILKGISLIGIDSVLCPMPLREIIWGLLANSWKPENLGQEMETVKLEELDPKIDLILQGKLAGRIVVDLE